MPTIPVYNRQISTSSIQNPRSSPAQETTNYSVAQRSQASAESIGNFAGGLAQLSNSMQRQEIEIQKAAKRQQSENAKARSLSVLTDAQIEWGKNLNVLKSQAQDSGENFLDLTLRNFDEFSSGILSQEKDPEALEYLKSRLNALKISTAEDALKFESVRGVEFRTRQFTESAHKRAQMAYSNPSYYDPGIKEMEEVLTAMDLPANVKADLKVRTRLAMADAATRAQLEANPQSILDYARDLKKAPEYFKALDVRQIDQYRNQAEAEIKRGTSLNLQMIRENEANAHAQYMSLGRAAGVPSLQDLELVYPKEEAKTRYDSLQESRRVGETIQSMRNLSESERQDILAKESPREGEDFRGRSARFREIVQASQQIRQEIQTDPAGFVLREWPEAQIAYSKMLENPTPENVAEYAMLQSSEQRRQGVMNPNLLTADMANQIAQRFQTPPSDQENPKTVIQGLSQQWGKYWPTVFEQLSRDNKLPDSAMVIANISDPNAQNILARAAGTKISDLEKGLPAVDVSESTGIPHRIRENLRPMLTSMSHNANGEDTFKKIFESAHKLALVYTRQGSNSTDAAKKAVDQIVNERYAFLDKNRTRIPKVERPEDVFTGATAYLKRELPNLDILIPQDHLRFYPNEKVRQKEIKAHIQNSAVWLPDPEETGLALYYTARDNTLVPVKTSGEKRIFFTWQELRKIEPYSILQNLRGGLSQPQSEIPLQKNLNLELPRGAEKFGSFR